MSEKMEMIGDDLFGAESYGGSAACANSKTVTSTVSNCRGGAAAGSIVGGAIGGKVGMKKFGATVGGVAGAYAQKGLARSGRDPVYMGRDRHSGDIDGRGGAGVSHPRVRGIR